MRPELAALIVHDLKNALGSLEAELLTLAPQPHAGPARAAYEHCAELRQRFVMFLTLYAANGALRAQTTDESPTGLLRTLAVPAGARDAPMISLAAEADAPPFWYFDRHLVRLALQAALHNASRFARSSVTLTARVEGKFLVFAVDDDGPGLGAADPSHHSTGLGTELCAAVARAHTNATRCGHVTLADRAGGGARFELWLP